MCFIDVLLLQITNIYCYGSGCGNVILPWYNTTLEDSTQVGFM